MSLFSIINDMTLPQFKDENIVQGFKRIKSGVLAYDKHNHFCFIISHSPCKVRYHASGFKAKNQDRVN